MFNTHCSAPLLVNYSKYISGVRPHLLFVPMCLSHKLASTNTCRSDTRQEGAEIPERNTTLESLPDDPSIETQLRVQGTEKKTSRDTLTLIGPETR